MQPMQRLTLIALAFVVSLGIGVGVFLYVSLLPHVELIGWLVAALVALGLGCSGWLLIAWTRSKVARLDNDSRVIRYGDYLVYKHDDGSFTHLSGIHQQMSLPPAAQVTVTEEQSVPEETILELHDKGMSLRDIVKATGAKYYEVQRITSSKKADRKWLS
jgi:hypothetical protein